MTPTIEPCLAGFDGCDALRAEAARKHPRTPRLRECNHLPIPPENPDRLQGPEIGTVCRYMAGGVESLVRVTGRSYVWAPGERSYHGGARRYDWSVVERLAIDGHSLVGTGRTFVTDDAKLTATEGAA